MYRNADGAGLVGNGAGDCLTDPPGGISRELVSLGIVELLYSLDKAQIALLDQIQKQHAAAGIAFGDGNNQTKIGLSQLLLGHIALFDKFMELRQIFLGEVSDLLVGNLDFTHGIFGIQYLFHGLPIGLFPSNDFSLGLIALGNG